MFDDPSCERRLFLREGAFALALLSADVGALTGCSFNSNGANAESLHSVAFSWNIQPVNNQPVACAFRLRERITLMTVALELALEVPARPGGPQYPAILTLRGGLVRLGNTTGGVSLSSPSVFNLSSDFGSVSMDDSNLVDGSFDQAPMQDVFCSSIVTVNSSNNLSSQRFTADLSLVAVPNDEFVFQLSHRGNPGNAEFRVVMGYA
jgi:hypothetical protein